MIINPMWVLSQFGPQQRREFLYPAMYELAGRPARTGKADLIYFYDRVGEDGKRKVHIEKSDFIDDGGLPETTIAIRQVGMRDLHRPGTGQVEACEVGWVLAIDGGFTEVIHFVGDEFGYEADDRAKTRFSEDLWKLQAVLEMAGLWRATGS